MDDIKKSIFHFFLGGYILFVIISYQQSKGVELTLVNILVPFFGISLALIFLETIVKVIEVENILKIANEFGKFLFESLRRTFLLLIIVFTTMTIATLTQSYIIHGSNSQTLGHFVFWSIYFAVFIPVFVIIYIQNSNERKR